VSPGDRVRDLIRGRLGTSKGPVFRYGVHWVLVEWDTGPDSIILEHCLELFDQKENDWDCTPFGEQR